MSDKVILVGGVGSDKKQKSFVSILKLNTNGTFTITANNQSLKQDGNVKNSVFVTPSRATAFGLNASLAKKSMLIANANASNVVQGFDVLDLTTLLVTPAPAAVTCVKVIKEFKGLKCQ